MKQILKNIYREEKICLFQRYITFHSFHIRSIDGIFPLSARRLKLIFNQQLRITSFDTREQAYKTIEHLNELKYEQNLPKITADSSQVLLKSILFAKIHQKKLGPQLNQSRSWKRLPHISFSFLGINIYWKNRQVVILKMSQQSNKYHFYVINEIFQKQIINSNHFCFLQEVSIDFRYFFAESITQQQRVAPNIPNPEKYQTTINKSPRLRQPQQPESKLYLPLDHYEIQTQEQQFEYIYNSLILQQDQQRLLQVIPQDEQLDMSDQYESINDSQGQSFNENDSPLNTANHILSNQE